MAPELKQLRCSIITCNRKNWFMLLDEYKAMSQAQWPHICPRCYTKINDGRLAPYQECNQEGKKYTRPQTLVTTVYDNFSDKILIKRLLPYSRYITTCGRFETDGEAMHKIFEMNMDEPERYIYVSIYRMQKEASAT